MVPIRRDPCQCIRRAVASGDAHVSHAVRRVHHHTSGRRIPVGVASGRTLRQWLPDRLPHIHRGWQASLAVVPLVSWCVTSREPNTKVRTVCRQVRQSYSHQMVTVCG
ncbi:hypothetical protein Ahy_A06g030793 isoform B [Arachis hypogaea]|uniref:Uncharacterized protein n=1 Tax=Arachis hypogaea TaxID=3818 RepID=A0A445CXL0_ARAHY|nr:hypothetical protein Ahy_A06g030793 isoform B [Arachis hypogaea]